jgi:aspartate aminotransferase
MAFLDVAGRSFEALTADPSLVQMGHNCNFLPLEPSIKQAMINALSDESFRNYAPSFGLERLRELVKDDVGVPDVEVLITHGATEAIYQAMATIVGPGDEVIVSDPAWPHIANFARSLGAKVISIPIFEAAEGYKLSVERVTAAATPRTKLITLIDPLNPTGAGYAPADIIAFAALAERLGSYFLQDATYRDFAQSFTPALKFSRRALMNVSLSKTCGFAGLRFGALLAHSSLFNKITDRQISRLGVNSVVQRGAIRAFETKGSWLSEMRRINAMHQDMIRKSLGNSGAKAMTNPSCGNFVAIDVTDTGLTAEKIVAGILEEGVVVRSGLYTSETYGDRFLRVTTTVPTASVTRFCQVFPTVMNRLMA